jgi:hypothetical protein
MSTSTTSCRCIGACFVLLLHHRKCRYTPCQQPSIKFAVCITINTLSKTGKHPCLLSPLCTLCPFLSSIQPCLTCLPSFVVVSRVCNLSLVHYCSLQAKGRRLGPGKRTRCIRGVRYSVYTPHACSPSKHVNCRASLGCLHAAYTVAFLQCIIPRIITHACVLCVLQHHWIVVCDVWEGRRPPR